MHPRMLAKDVCSGGTCPAVYALDDRPDELVVQGKRADATLLSRLTGVAPHEGAVTIKRETVAEALRPTAEPAGIEELQAQFERFGYSAFRLETLQCYAGTGPDASWAALVRANRRWGKTHQRVHVVINPLSRAMQEELTAGYAPNVAAGEDIGIISLDEDDEWPEEIPRFDFWLFDSSRLYVMHYDPDGTWTGADRITDPERIVEACEARDALLFHATPWKHYIDVHPDLTSLLG